MDSGTGHPKSLPCRFDEDAQLCDNTHPFNVIIFAALPDQ
jgi:hypothetical protein